ncbi:leukocyte elastase inhibitor isoform X2 [Xylocopa sonorina]
MMEQSCASSLNNKDIVFKNLSASCNDFTKAFYKELSSGATGNIVSSPLSIHMILSYLSHGAESSTLAELTKGLCHYDKDSVKEGYKSLITQLNDLDNIELHIANAMYVQNKFELLAEFLILGKEVYQSEISKVDFTRGSDTAAKINTWIKDKTNKKILNLVSSDDFNEYTKLVLINAIYFNGSWLRAFNTKNTKNRIFHVTKDQTKLVPTMFIKAEYSYGKIPQLKAKFIEIPYMNTDIVMTVILPNEVDGLLDVQNNFSWEVLANATRFNSDVKLYLPKFKIEFKMDLKNILHKLGLSTIFKTDANFSHISNIPLLVSKVLQKAVIDVTEEGTEAAAATGVLIRCKRRIDLDEKELFIVDRPFMFIIEYKTNNIPLFIGCVQDIEIASQKDEL